MTPHKHETTRRIHSEAFPGVTFLLRKMTEGRRMELRRIISEPNLRVREILREQDAIYKTEENNQDTLKWMTLQDELDGLMLEKINPAWVLWGVKQIEGLEVDGRPLSVEDWSDWPSALFDEVLSAVKAEAELNGAERKNFSSPTTSGDLERLSQEATTVETVGSAGGGETGTVTSITGT